MEKFNDSDFNRASSYLDSVLVSCKNDPGLFDSLAVIHRLNRENFSGYHQNVTLSFFPGFVAEKIRVSPENVFSDFL